MTPPKSSSFLIAELKDIEVGKILAEDVGFYGEKVGNGLTEVTNEHTNLT